MQARGKKNLVISQELAGPVGLFVKFSVLQEYGVDRVFLLENANIDSSHRNVVFLIRGEKAQHVRIVAGRCLYDVFIRFMYLPGVYALFGDIIRSSQTNLLLGEFSSSSL